MKPKPPRAGSETWWGDQIPGDWEYIGMWGNGFALRCKGLRVIIDCEKKEDGNEWIHVSYSREHWPPTHADTLKVKEDFLRDRYAYAVFPTAERYVNIHPNCLHLWARRDGQPVLPHFDSVVEGVGRSI